MPIKVKRAIHHLPYNGYTYVLDFQIKPEITKCQFFFHDLLEIYIETRVFVESILKIFHQYIAQYIANSKYR